MTPVSKIRLQVLAVLVIAVLGALFTWPKGPNWIRKEVKLHLGLDLAGGAHLVYQADLTGIPVDQQTAAVEGARDVIERRVNALGVGEPIVQTNRSSDGYRVIVELPGITDVNEAIKRIGDTPVLEFKEQAEPEKLTDTEKQERVKFNADQEKLAGTLLEELKNKSDADFAAKAKEVSNDPGTKDKGGDLGFIAPGLLVPGIEEVLFDKLKDGEMYDQVVKTDYGYHLVRRVETQCKNTETDKVVTCPPTEELNAADSKIVQEIRGRHILLQVLSEEFKAPGEQWKSTRLSGKYLKASKVIFDNQTGMPIVSMEFNKEGANLFEAITGRNVGKPVAIFLDGNLLSAPRVESKISGGSAVISGNFSIVEAKELAKRLNSGALPIKITLLSQQQVGASLGQESVENSFLAGVLGLLMVIIFMIAYYRLPGLVSAIALIIYALIITTIFKLVPVVLTLSGMAGFIMTIGLAVDANVLIFERLKEELRAGKSLQAAIDEGFARAWTSIRDSNVSTLITAFILLWLGETMVKGFGITLALGVIVSMFTAITVTRVLLKFIAQQVKVSGWWWGK
ncbi:MAG TPA: protein translocase subunit SecD [Candidatus Jacksonbacteria bacterium]|nr:protein translocase subunit SecD [Candidatus Jacksonbacteria bacterium]